MTATANDIQRLIECCICYDYLTDLRETPCCHQLFCHQCIRSWLATSTQTCPRCRSTSLNESSLLQNIVVQRFVDNLQFDCPNKLDGCPAKIPRTDLMAHKRSCTYSSEKLAAKRREKLRELENLFTKYKSGKGRVTDENISDLAESFLKEHEYQRARDALKLSKNENKTGNFIFIAAKIERDDGKYEAALRFYSRALPLVNTTVQKIEILLASGQLHIKQAHYPQAKEDLNRALELLKNNDQPQIRAEILNANGLISKKCSEYDQAITAYNEALEIVDVQTDLWSEIISNLADIHRKKGNYDQAKDLYLKSLQLMESLHGQNHPSIGDIMNNLGVLYKKEGKYSEALDYFKQAIKISRHYYGSTHPSIGIYLTNIGDIYRKQSDFKKAESTYKEALTALEKSYGKNHIEVAEVLNSMGLVLKKRADYDGAEEHYKRAIQIVHSTFGENQEHYKLGIYYNNLADLDRKRNRFDEALKLYQRALTSIEKTLGPEHSEAAEILHNIGQVQHQLGNYSQAIDYINRALKIIEKEFDNKHYKYGMFLNSLGLAYAMLDEYQAAYVHMKQSLQILLTSLGQDHIEVCDVFSNLGDVCMKIVAETEMGKNKPTKAAEKQEKLDEAKKYYTHAQRIAQATFGPDHTKSRQFLSLLFIIDNYNSM